MAHSCRKNQLPCRIPQRIKGPSQRDNSCLSCPMGHKCPFNNRGSDYNVLYHCNNNPPSRDERIVTRTSDTEVYDLEEDCQSPDDDGTDTFVCDEEDLCPNSDYLVTDDDVVNEENDDSNNNYMRVDCNTHHFLRDDPRELNMGSQHDRTCGLSKSRSTLSIGKHCKFQNQEKNDLETSTSHRPYNMSELHRHRSSSKLNAMPSDSEMNINPDVQPCYSYEKWRLSDVNKNSVRENNNREKVLFHPPANNHGAQKHCHHFSSNRHHCSLTRINSSQLDDSNQVICSPPDHRNNASFHRRMPPSNRSDSGRNISLKNQSRECGSSDNSSAERSPPHEYHDRSIRRHCSRSKFNNHDSMNALNNQGLCQQPDDNCMLTFRRVLPRNTKETRRHCSPEKLCRQTSEEHTSSEPHSIQNHSYPLMQNYCPMNKTCAPQPRTSRNIDYEHTNSSRPRKASIRNGGRELSTERSMKHTLPMDSRPEDVRNNHYDSYSSPLKQNLWKHDPRQSGCYLPQSKDGRPPHKGHYYRYDYCRENLCPPPNDISLHRH